MCMDQFGWTEEETVLKFGILLGALGFVSIFLFASVGPLCRKFDERKILIFLGIFFMFLGRLFVFPIPGWDLPPLASDNSTLKSRRSSYYVAKSSPCILSFSMGFPAVLEVFQQQLQKRTVPRNNDNFTRMCFGMVQNNASFDPLAALWRHDHWRHRLSLLHCHNPVHLQQDSWTQTSRSVDGFTISLWKFFPSVRSYYCKQCLQTLRHLLDNRDHDHFHDIGTGGRFGLLQASSAARNSTIDQG